jgi:hypothetical protein
MRVRLCDKKLLIEAPRASQDSATAAVSSFLSHSKAPKRAPKASDEFDEPAPSAKWARPSSRMVVDPPPVGGQARCLVRTRDELHAFVGEVVRVVDSNGPARTTNESTAKGVEIKLLGSGANVIFVRPELQACDAAPAHRWADSRVVIERQRRGEPAERIAVSKR